MGEPGKTDALDDVQAYVYHTVRLKLTGRPLRKYRELVDDLAKHGRQNRQLPSFGRCLIRYCIGVSGLSGDIMNFSTIVSVLNQRGESELPRALFARKH